MYRLTDYLTLESSPCRPSFSLVLADFSSSYLRPSVRPFFSRRAPCPVNSLSFLPLLPPPTSPHHHHIHTRPLARTHSHSTLTPNCITYTHSHHHQPPGHTHTAYTYAAVSAPRLSCVRPMNHLFMATCHPDDPQAPTHTCESAICYCYRCSCQ